MTRIKESLVKIIWKLGGQNWNSSNRRLFFIIIFCLVVFVAGCMLMAFGENFSFFWGVLSLAGLIIACITSYGAYLRHQVPQYRSILTEEMVRQSTQGELQEELIDRIPKILLTQDDQNAVVALQKMEELARITVRKEEIREEMKRLNDQWYSNNQRYFDLLKELDFVPY